MLSVCSTRPLHGAAKYSSRWRALFQPNVATRASAARPSASSAPARRRVRSAHSPYVIRSRPVAVNVVTVLSGNRRSARLNTCGRVSGNCDIWPSIGSPLSRARGSSIAGQRSITTRRPAARPRSAAASSITPSCIQTALAPIAIASSTCSPASSARRKTSTTSTCSGTSASRAYTRSPRISAPAAGLTGITRCPRRCSSAAMRCEARVASGEQPTTAQTRVPVRIARSSLTAGSTGEAGWTAIRRRSASRSSTSAVSAIATPVRCLARSSKSSTIAPTASR